MNEFIPLGRPLQSQVSINPSARECPSLGFNYPTFRQLNKQARLYLSQPLKPDHSHLYHVLAISNPQGWFVAVRAGLSQSELICSTLEDLRSAFNSAKPDQDDVFTPKRVLPITFGKVNIVALAQGDTRLLVGSDQGILAIYDTTSLFTASSDVVRPLKSVQLQANAFRQIVPNPGSEQNLSELFAVVGDGKVQLLDLNLEFHAGWAAIDLMTQPITVSWSPKGKHLAIGLQTGDILTFSLANKSSPHKHIPPTADAILVSLHWLGPGHTFRTSYAANGGNPAQQHIISLDTKTSTATYFAPEHPFPSYDRTQQDAYILTFPKWDEDSTPGDDSKSLVIIGDVCSVDLEVVGHAGSVWHRQSQENPLSLPLDKSMDDTMLLALEADLTDSNNGTPIMYAYLNDGSLQGWYVEHPKPYIGMITPGATVSSIQPSKELEQKDADMGAEQSSQSNAFGVQPSNATPFGFGQQSTFGQPTFGSSSSRATPAFGQTSPFGSMSSFPSSAGTAFGQTSQPGTTTSAFGTPAQPAAAFSAFGGAPSVFGAGAFSNFGSSTSNVFGQGSFGSSSNSTLGNVSTSDSSAMTREASMSDSTPTFGGLGLGGSHPPDDKAVNSMFGSFGTPSSNTQSNATSPFGGGGVVKPATGFGALETSKPSNAFEIKANSNPPNAFAPIQPSSSGFGQSGFSSSPGAGKSIFGQPAFGKSSLTSSSPSASSGGFAAYASTSVSFGTSTPLGSSATGASSHTPSTTTSAFGAFASNTPAPFGSGLQTTTADMAKASSASGGGVNAFASPVPPTFSSALTPKADDPTTGATPSASPFGTFSTAPSTSFSLSATTSPSKATPSTNPLATVSPFGPQPVNSVSGGTSVFGKQQLSRSNSNSPKSATDISPPSSPEPDRASPFGVKPTESSPAATPGGAFSNLKTTPSFKPATGFGAFNNQETPKASPFFRKPEESPITPVSIFGQTPSSHTKASTTPTFGSPSALGSSKAIFGSPIPASPAPDKTTAASSAFGAFSGVTSPFGNLGGSKSFMDLLKIGDNDSKDPVKATTTSVTPPAASQDQDKGKGATSSSAISAFLQNPKNEETATTQVGDSKPSVISAFPPVPRDQLLAIGNEKKAETGESGQSSGKISDEPSYGTISASSTSSSFVEVGGDRDGEFQGGDESDEDAEHNADDGFLTDDNYSEGSAPEDESAEETSADEDREVSSSPPEPATIPLPASRSASSTPQPEVPRISVSSLSASEEKTASPPATFTREPSTTPPGTPVKETKPSFVFGPSPSPSSLPSAMPFGLGLGRPSTRPARSSPLANAIHPGDEGGLKAFSPVPFATSPRPISGASLEIEDDTERSTYGQPPSKRPKTPPLLSTLTKSPANNQTMPSLVPPASTPVLKSASAPPDPSKTTQSLPFGPITKASTSSPAPCVKPPQADQNAAGPFPLPAALQAPISKANQPGASSFSANFSMPPFSLKSASAPPAPTPTPSVFHFNSTTPPQRAPSGAPIGSLSASPPHVPSVFVSQKATQSDPASFGWMSTKASSSVLPHLSGPGVVPQNPRTTPAPSAQSPQESTMEDGMQKECANLVIAMNKELEDLNRITVGTKQKLVECSVSKGGSRQKADLGDPMKWNLVDLVQFSQLLLQYKGDFDEIESRRSQTKQALRDIRNSLLKVGTRREEVDRFEKAKDDKEFARMLRARTLGPEHSETQTQLRKNIRAIRDRVQKLEARLQECKKRLAQSKTGKPAFKAPSLDTINRTYRNIDSAIQQQGDDVARLAVRISKLDVKDSLNPAVPRDARLPEAGMRRPYLVTENVAVTTAAALNAERSADRLKRALLAVRKTPLLNARAATAPKPPTTFNTPQKPATPFFLQTPLGGHLFDTPSPPPPLPPWNGNDDDFKPGGSPLPTRRGGGPPRKKHGFVTGERTGQAATTSATPTPSFDWGPLPSFPPTIPGMTNLPKSFVPLSTPPKK